VKEKVKLHKDSMTSMQQEPIQLVPIVQYPVAVPEQMQQQQQVYVAPTSPDSDVENSNSQAEMEREMLIRTNITWVSAFLIGQFALSVIALLNGAFIFFIINSIFLIIGVRGLSTRNRCLLVTHFVYSLIVLFGLITVTIIIVFYRYTQINHFWLFALSSLIVIETICLRKQRILIQHLPKTCRRACRWGRQQVQSDLEQGAPDDSVSIQVSPVVPVPLFVPFPGYEGKQQDDTNAAQPQPIVFYPQAQGGFQFAQPFILQAPSERQN